MNYPVLAFATVAAMTAIASGNEFLCDIPTAGCANGMFNQVTCSCDCIPPFCPDALGNCLVSGTCEDPWKNCTRGKNCPWWANPLKAESCTTGPKVGRLFLVKLETDHTSTLRFVRFQMARGTSSLQKRFAVKQTFLTLNTVHRTVPLQPSIQR